MVCYDAIEYGNLRSLFDREYKRVAVYKNRALTKDIKLRIEYKTDLVRTYNDILKFFQPIPKSISLEDKLDIQTLIVDLLRKLKESFSLLKLEYNFSKNIHDTIDFDKITQNWSDIDSDQSDSSTKDDTLDDNTHTDKVQSVVDESLKESTSTSTGITKENNNLNTNNTNKEQKMVQSAEDFMALAHRTINYKFGGDPLALDSFIDAIKLLNELCKPENKNIMIQFIMTKLEGDAREAIEIEAKTSDEIINQLKAHIKPESSKVVEGRMLALRADKTNLTNFSQRAEELAEQYRRSLCKEGYSKDKAKELAIEKTVDLCRRSARSEQVRTIIASKAFTEPKEVIAKMIVEINNLKLDKNATQYSNKYNNHNKNSNNKSHKPNNGNQNSRYNNRNSGQSNSQNGNNNRQNWHNNSNGNRGGRGNNNGYNSRTFNNSNNSNNGNNNNGNGRRYDQSVRCYSGNEMNPGNGGQNSEQTQ